MTAPHITDTVGGVIPLHRDRIVTVGREGDLAFPDNEYLHRHLVAVYWHDEAWWIENVGSWIPVRYAAEGEAISALLAVGRAERLGAARTHLVFRAGRTEYEVVVVVPEIADPLRTRLPRPAGSSTTGPDELTHEQVVMLVAFCEPLLRYPGVGLDRLRSMRETQERLGWSSSKLRRKLDYLCEKLDDAGVGGLVSDDGPATNRRIVLCEWALSTRTVTPAMLRLLP